MTPLRNEREKRRLTQLEVASAVDLDQSQYSKIELGKLRTTPQTAERLAIFFGHAISEMQILYPERYLPLPREHEAAPKEAA